MQPFDCTDHKVTGKLGLTFHIFLNKGNKKEKWQIWGRLKSSLVSA